ncbi:alcohol dehydrogenase superfamily, zinc-type protein, partial [Kipferlia bialata]
VVSASVNPIDNILRMGWLRQMIPLQFPYRMGNDVSGVVEEVGSEVTGFSKGDAVYARPNPMQSGTFADFVSVKAEDVAKKPPSITHGEAASIPLVGLTAYQALTEHAGLKAGQKVLIHAGTGGVGSAAIQIAKHLGAGEIATTCSGVNTDRVKALGADVAIDYRTQKFEDVVSEYDVVIDTIGGETRERSFGVLKKGGIVVSVTGDQDPEGHAAKAGVRFVIFFMHASGSQLETLGDMIETGTLKPTVDSTYPLGEVRAALEYSMTKHAQGKIVIEVAAE